MCTGDVESHGVDVLLVISVFGKFGIWLNWVVGGDSLYIYSRDVPWYLC